MEFFRYKYAFNFMILVGPTEVGESWFLRALLAERRWIFIQIANECFDF